MITKNIKIGALLLGASLMSPAFGATNVKGPEFMFWQTIGLELDDVADGDAIRSDIIREQTDGLSVWADSPEHILKKRIISGNIFPLCVAVKEGKVRSARFLFDFYRTTNDDFRVLEHNGKGLVRLAVESGNPQMLALVCEQGVEGGTGNSIANFLRMPGRDGKSACEISLSGDNESMAHILKESMDRLDRIERAESIAKNLALGMPKKEAVDRKKVQVKSEEQAKRQEQEEHDAQQAQEAQAKQKAAEKRAKKKQAQANKRLHAAQQVAGPEVKQSPEIAQKLAAEQEAHCKSEGAAKANKEKQLAQAQAKKEHEARKKAADQAKQQEAAAKKAEEQLKQQATAEQNVKAKQTQQEAQEKACEQSAKSLERAEQEKRYVAEQQAAEQALQKKEQTQQKKERARQKKELAKAQTKAEVAQRMQLQQEALTRYATSEQSEKERKPTEITPKQTKLAAHEKAIRRRGNPQQNPRYVASDAQERTVLSGPNAHIWQQDEHVVLQEIKAIDRKNTRLEEVEYLDLGRTKTEQELHDKANFRLKTRLLAAQNEKLVEAGSACRAVPPVEAEEKAVACAVQPAVVVSAADESFVHNQEQADQVVLAEHDQQQRAHLECVIRIQREENQRLQLRLANQARDQQMASEQMTKQQEEARLQVHAAQQIMSEHLLKSHEQERLRRVEQEQMMQAAGEQAAKQQAQMAHAMQRMMHENELKVREHEQLRRVQQERVMQLAAQRVARQQQQNAMSEHIIQVQQQAIVEQRAKAQQKALEDQYAHSLAAELTQKRGVSYAAVPGYTLHPAVQPIQSQNHMMPFGAAPQQVVQMPFVYQAQAGDVQYYESKQ